jgi:hypothetical protein
MVEGLKGRDRRERTQRAVLLVLLTLLCLAATPLGAVGALFSPLVFDHRPNLLNPLAWLGFVLMIGFWIVCIIAPFIAWVAWKRGREPVAWMAIAGPLVWLIALGVTLQFIPG